MNVSDILNKLKSEPGFADNVGMTLIHNGTVRSWSRFKEGDVTSIEVTPDLEKIEEFRKEFEAKPGIFRIEVEAASGRLVPGDDLLIIAVAGDIREHVKPVLADLLDRIKSEAVLKKEVFSD